MRGSSMPSALVSLEMFGYVSSTVAGIAASFVLIPVCVCVSAVAARFSAFKSVEVTDFAFPVHGLGEVVKTGGSVAFSGTAFIVKSSWLFWSVLPRMAVRCGPPPSLCQWDASCQLVPVFATGFCTAAGIAFVVAIILWKCCAFCSGSHKEWKTGRLSKLVEEKKMGFVSLQVASWFAAAAMERCIGKLQTAAALRLAFVSDFELKGMFTVGSVTPCPEEKFVLPSGHVCCC